MSSTSTRYEGLVGFHSTLHKVHSKNRTTPATIVSNMAARRLGEPSAKGFDPDTGQVYMERTCKAGSMTPDWTWKTPRRLESSIERLNHAAPGSASLRDISIRTVLANLFNLSPGMMETLPLHLTRQLWLKIKSR